MSLFKYDHDLLRAACERHGMSVCDGDTTDDLFLKFTYRRAKDASAAKELMPATCVVYRTWAKKQHSNGTAVDASELAARWRFVLSTVLKPDDVPMEHAIYNSMDAKEKQNVEPVVWDEERVYVRSKVANDEKVPKRPADTDGDNDKAKRPAEDGEDDEEARRSKMRRAAEARAHVPLD